LDRKIKHAAAQLEDAWHGMGQKAPEVRVWRIEKFQVKAWPKDRYGQFHMGDSYIILYTYQRGNSLRLHHNLHIWIGNESSQDEYGTAAYKMVEADDYLGGIPVQHREVQGHESDLFKSYFDFLQYLEGGIETGFNHVEPTEERPFLFRVKGTRKQMTLCQVPLSKNSLNSGDSFILKVDKARVWCWNGTSARPLEKANAVLWAEFMCTRGTVTVVAQDDDDESEHVDFWEYLGEGEIGPDMEDDHLVVEFRPKLYRVDGDPTKELELVAEGTEIKKTSKVCSCLQETALDGDDVFLLDSGWEVFIWVGTGADKAEKLAAMGAADRYAKIEPRAMELPVTIVKQGQETDQFWTYFEGPQADKSRADTTFQRQGSGIRSAAMPWEKEAAERGGALSSLSLADETFARMKSTK
jgi:gelsolin